METQLGNRSQGSPPQRKGRPLARRVLWTVGLVLVVGAGVLAAGWLLPAEYRIQGEVVIPRPAERVWMGFVHPDRWPKWLPGIRASAGTTNPLEGVGSRRRIVAVLPGGRELISEVEVTEWEEGVRYAHRHLTDSLDGRSLPVSDGRVEVALEPVSDQACRLRFSASFRADGPLTRWWAFVVGKPLGEAMLRERLDQLHARLKQRGSGS